MKETKYITIGTPIISNDIFRNILRPLDNFSLKPTGGLWASKFNLPYGKICPWFDYLLDARGIARSISEYRDLTKATIFTLKENANILTINTSNQILELSKKYPSYYQSLNYIYEITERNTIFDYEALSKVYDGIYINYEEIYREIKSEVFDSWSIDTLLLFNLNCIKEYQSVKINVNFHDLYPLPYIDMKKDLSTPKLISNRSINYNEIYNYVESIFKELTKEIKIQSFSNYDEFFETIIYYASEALKIATISKDKIKKVYRSNKFKDNEIITLIKKKNINPILLDMRDLDKMCKGLHQGIILEVEDVKTYSLEDIIPNIDKEYPLVVLLDHIEDPHNFGAIIRSCEAFGVDAIIIPNDRSVDITGTVVKASVGTIEKVKIIKVTNLNNTIKKLKDYGYWVVGTDMEGTVYTDIDYKMKTALIIGNEGKGISRLVSENCDYLAKIPMSGTVNSLNASVACGIFLAEINRSRGV